MVLCLIKFWQRQRYISQLVSKIPGPKAYPLIGNILDILAWTPEETVQKYKRIAKTYSPTFQLWIGPQLAIAVCDPRDLEILMNSRKCLGRDRLQKIFDKYPLGDGLIAIGGEQWRIHRKFVLQSFTYNNFEFFVKVFDENSKILVDCLKLTSNTNNSIHILDYLNKFTFDSICENMMGFESNSQKKKHEEYIESLTTYLYIFTNMVMKPWLLIPILFRLTSNHKKMTKSRVFMNMFCDEIVSKKTKDYREQSKDIKKEEHLESFTKINRPTLLESMIQLIENNECSFSKKEVTGEINFMLWAGMDTTSTSLSFTMMLLGFHQDVQRKVHEELDAVFGDDMERSVSMEDLNNLQYTEQVIKESLRLYPAVPFVPRTSTEDIEINGYTIPKGCDVIFNIYYLHRNPKIYPNPDEFDPENFSPERSKGRHPYKVTGEINFMLWAGMDTTSTSLSFTMMLLGFHQDVQRKVHEELDAVFGDDMERSVSMEDLNNLQYTEQVIKESLRLYPAVPFVPRTSTEDIEINGYTIPKGCDVIFNIYYLHRNPKIYPNPDEFDPENFSPERSKGRHPYSFLPFSGGLRKCVGYKYAMIQMKIVLATVLRHFTVHPACDKKEMEQWDLNLVLKMIQCKNAEYMGTNNIRSTHLRTIFDIDGSSQDDRPDIVKPTRSIRSSPDMENSFSLADILGDSGEDSYKDLT
uniref:Cytochrome P450 n=1 Tax=Timema douglasi TaxID=61478 RepID=A0A7R8VN03_TIMDO|nr:unnamed protein product [Timema douglasi]